MRSLYYTTTILKNCKDVFSENTTFTTNKLYFRMFL